ncbi:MAG: Type 1 glutamine amidotransferase-like domain-containing protein [archaeon]|jgi:dipeptidase E
MDFYLTSYHFGKAFKEFGKMAPKNKKVAVISNAVDYYTDQKRKEKSQKKIFKKLIEVGLKPETVDLKDYFGKKKKLEKKLKEFGAFWIKGGNTFFLRKAMELSGFDKIFAKLVKKKNLLYGGSSAGVCILGPDLRGIELVDSIKKKPYGKKVNFTALGVFDYYFLPHYKSKHPEMAKIKVVMNHYIKQKKLFKTIQDGETIIIKNGMERIV